MAKTNFRSVDEYITTHPEDVQSILQRVRSTIRKAALSGSQNVTTHRGKHAAINTTMWRDLST